MKAQDKGKRKRAISLSLPQTLHDSLISDFNKALDNSAQWFQSHWTDACRFKVQYLRENLLSKYCDSSTTPALTRRSGAISKWLRMDLRNGRTNTRLLIDSADFGPFKSQQVVKFARKVILQILGNTPPAHVLDGMFTNGASTSTRKSSVAIAQKIGRAHV